MSRPNPDLSVLMNIYLTYLQRNFDCWSRYRWCTCASKDNVRTLTKSGSVQGIKYITCIWYAHLIVLSFLVRRPICRALQLCLNLSFGPRAKKVGQACSRLTESLTLKRCF